MKKVYTPKREGTANDWSENKITELSPKKKAIQIYESHFSISKEITHLEAIEHAKITVDSILSILFQHHRIDFYKKVKRHLNEMG